MQVKSMQERPHQLASRRPGDGRSIAQKRRDLIAQVERMALSDLAQVSARLKALHVELNQHEGKRVTFYELSEALGVAHRTLQSWENGEVENRDGKGYDKMARYYSRKLGRKITRQWILFGDGEAAPPAADLSEALTQAEPASTEKLEQMLREVLDQQAQLLADVSQVRSEQEHLSRLLERRERDRAATRKSSSA